MSDLLDIAERTAETILELSWEENKVLYVGLYGSLLRTEEAGDIDLLVIHDQGWKLPATTSYNGIVPDAPIEEEENYRHSPTGFLRLLGYKEKLGGSQSVLEYVKDIVPSQEINETFDFNALDQILLADEGGAVRGRDIIGNRFGLYKFVMTLHGEEPKSTNEILGNMRQEAIDVCRETSFWYTAISECRLFDPDSGKFDTHLTDLYPDATKFYPSEPKYVHKSISSQ